MNNKDITVNKILEVCEGKLISGNKDLKVENFSKDTRDITDGSLYIAIRGERTDGNDYIEDAFENGAIGCIVDKLLDKKKIDKNADKVIIYVKDSIDAIQKLAKYKRSLYNIPVVAVTGSVGKTSTKDIIASVLSQEFKVLKTRGNYNNHIGVPLTILGLKEHTAAVIEMGMNHLGEISILTDIAKPTISVITNIGTSHIGNLGSRENILKAKLEVLKGMDEKGIIIINNDNDLLNDWARKNIKYKVNTYGIDNKSDYMAYNIELLPDKSIFNSDIDRRRCKIDVPVAGLAFIYNSLSGIAVGDILNIKTEKIIKGISEIKLTSSRMDIQKIKDDILIINDSYNASYDSTKAALEVLKNTKAAKRIAILGDMLELGDYAEELHKEVGNEVVKNSIDVLITVGENAKYIAERVKELGGCNTYICRNNEEAIHVVNSNVSKNDVILLKASNGMKFNEILEKLKED